MRVLHVTQPTTEGVGLCVLRLAAGQRARGWDVAVACPSDDELAVRLAQAGVSVHPWPARRPVGPATLSEVRRLAAIVERADPELVHLHSAKAGLAGRLAVRGSRPTVHHPHAWSFSAATGALARASVRWEAFAARWTDLVLCCSHAELEAGRRAGVRSPMVVVGNGVDLAAFPRAGGGARAEARAALGLGPEPTAVCLGRLCHQKGQDLLLAAWPDVLAKVPDARLVLVGDGPARAELEAAGARRVEFAGLRRDPEAWLAAADVVVLPTRYEGLSLVVLEAMATGRSVVAHDVEGMGEALGPHAGALVVLGDRQRLATAVAERLGDPVQAEREGRAGRTRVEATYGLDAWIDAVMTATAPLAAQISV